MPFTETVASLIRWIQSLDAGFAFLLALPFAVAVAGLLAEAVHRARLRGETRDTRP